MSGTRERFLRSPGEPAVFISMIVASFVIEGLYRKVTGREIHVKFLHVGGVNDSLLTKVRGFWTRVEPVAMSNSQYIDTVEDETVINANVEAVYDHVIKRPNKLPSSWLFETRPFLIVRGFSLGFFGGALFMLRASRKNAPEMNSKDLEPGSKYGPLLITAVEPSVRFGTRLKTLVLDMDIDFLFTRLDETRSKLIMKVTARSKNRFERMGIKAWEPVHHYMGRKMLAIYKKEIEAARDGMGSEELSSERA